ncbi:hypothetical protein M422DRAFT_25120 [Sphaerobolus stellatus SS14]|nr:hypothetical protein M422DRAFT_25120 [Sphaerobolus stellatus SS14]
MAHLTKPELYDIEDCNIALLGSDLEKRVREHAGDKEPVWESAGLAPGTQIWRVERFKIIPWPEERKGSFYSGDSYIVLHTYKKDPNSEQLSYDLHFWLGQETTQDEAGTAAYKTVELDDHLHGAPVQYRELQGYESPRFLSYFRNFVTLRGGISTGFHHVSSPPPLDVHKLYHIKAIATGSSVHGSQFIIREVAPHVDSIRKAEGDVLVLDKGAQIWQFNRKGSAGKERFRAAEFIRSIVEERQKTSKWKSVATAVFDEDGAGAGTFLADLGTDALSISETMSASRSTSSPALFRISDATGAFQVAPVPASPPRLTDLSTSDVFILDDTGNPDAPVLYAWVGREANAEERRLGVSFGLRYIARKEGNARKLTVVKVNEGKESDEFLRVMEA